MRNWTPIGAVTLNLDLDSVEPIVVQATQRETLTAV